MKRDEGESGGMKGNDEEGLGMMGIGFVDYIKQH